MTTTEMTTAMAEPIHSASDLRSADSFKADRGPLFVVGMWRSGTSLFYRLLNQHPQIALMYEGDLPVLKPLFAWGNRKAYWAEYWDFWSGALRRHSIDPASIPEGITDLKTAVRTVYRAYAGPEAIWGCKSPSYYDRMDLLHDLFPDARFIIIWRNPADVCRSVARAGETSYSWFNRRWMFERALFGCRMLRSQCDALLKRGAHIHQIQYGDLVRDPVGTMSGVCEFLDLPFDARMATLKGGDHSAIDPAAHHEKVKSDQIEVPGTREEVLTDQQKSKIGRYIRLWQRQYHGEWPRVRESLDDAASTPSLFERLADTIKYRSIRAYDRFKLVVYCFAPLWLLNRYRIMAGKPAILIRQSSPAKPGTVS